jgi:hypothetical protein|tara:strand:+ start:43165 stop:44340 length:1176 start_codon:yes stop_codon:yes gene_type:complete
MNFLENYALSCNLKVDKPKIRDSYYPILYDNYIVIDSSSVDPLFVYEHWQKVLNLISEPLRKKGIYTLQIGPPDSPRLENIHRTNGTTTYNQISYVLKKSKLLVSGNSFSLHVATSLGLRSISLVRNREASPFSPYWNENCDSLTGCKDDAFDGRPINQIKPEDVAKSICSFFNIDLDFPFKTIYIGEKNKDGMEFVESIPNQSVNLTSMGVSSIIFRMDLIYDESYLSKQLEQGKCTIVTNRRINFKILENFKSNINEIVYMVQKTNDDEEFCRFCINLGVSVILISELSVKETNHKKMIYMDIGNILPQNPHTKTKKKISALCDLKKCVYLSNKYTLSNGKIYTSEASWLSNTEAQSKKSVQNIYLKDDKFWKNLDTYWILEKCIDLKK